MLRTFLLLSIPCFVFACGEDKEPGGGVVERPASPGVIVALASQLRYPSEIVADANAVYATTGGPEAGCLDDCPYPDGALVRVGFADGVSPFWVSAEQMQSIALAPSGVAAAMKGGRIVQLDSGGRPSTLSNDHRQPFQLIADRGSLYWVDCGSCGFDFNPDAKILRLAPNTATATVVATPGEYVGGMASDGEELFISRSETSAGVSVVELRAVRIDTGATRTLDTMMRTASPVAVDATDVYYIDLDEVKKVPKQGGAVTVLAKARKPRSLAVDATHVYFTDAGPRMIDGAIDRVAKAGGALETLAADQDQPYRLTIDDTYVYWTNAGRYDQSTGAVMVLKKP